MDGLKVFKGFLNVLFLILFKILYLTLSLNFLIQDILDFHLNYGPNQAST